MGKFIGGNLSLSLLVRQEIIEIGPVKTVRKRQKGIDTVDFTIHSISLVQDVSSQLYGHDWR